MTADGSYYRLGWNADSEQLAPMPGGKLSVIVEFKGKREVGGKEFPVWKLEFTTDDGLKGEVEFTVENATDEVNLRIDLK